MPLSLRIRKVSISGIESNTTGNLANLSLRKILTGGRFGDLLIHLLVLFSEILSFLFLNLNRSIKQFVFHTKIKRIKLILRTLINNL